MTSLVLSVLGEDRPGLVSTVSRTVETRGGSWQRSQLARLDGMFAGIVVVDVPEAAVGDLGTDLAALAAEGLEVRVTRAEGDRSEPAAPGLDRWQLHLIGQDRPGIVAEVSQALADRGVGVDELVTEVREAPQSGGHLFEVDAWLSLPAGTDEAAVRDDLEQLADELMVDLDLEEL
jgi:glycine cleavage system regulatory protein